MKDAPDQSMVIAQTWEMFVQEHNLLKVATPGQLKCMEVAFYAGAQRLLVVLDSGAAQLDQDEYCNLLRAIDDEVRDFALLQIHTKSTVQ